MGIPDAMTLWSKNRARRVKAKKTSQWERELLRDGWSSKNARGPKLFSYETIEGKIKVGPEVDFEQERKNVGEGWQPIIQKLHDDLTALDPNYKIAQIKQKFGGLRYYISPSEECEDPGALHDLTYQAEAESLATCEVCGKPGKPRSEGWVSTLCDSHHEESQKRRAERSKNAE